jgi:hypothetical protein
MTGTIRHVCRNVKREMLRRAALETAAGMMETTKGFPRLKAYRYRQRFGSNFNVQISMNAEAEIS